MTAITIEVTDEKWQRLKDIAQKLGITPEKLVQFSLEDLISKPDPVFDQALQRVLSENAELYRRLA
jgi:antitoxin FitA